MNALKSVNYDGFVSIEWDPEWDEVSDIDIIFPHFISYMSRFELARQRSVLYDNNAKTGKYVWKKETLIEKTFSGKWKIGAPVRGRLFLYASAAKETLAFPAIFEYNKLNYYLFVRALLQTPLPGFGRCERLACVSEITSITGFQVLSGQNSDPVRR
jgi:hypothetical protein